MDADSNKLEIQYFPISNLARFENNAKMHDLGKIAELIKRYGFKDPLKLEPSLNNGRGGIVEGNGRLETLLWMKKQGQEVPRGIKVDEQGQWCAPVILGVDALDEGEAIAYSIDHNNSVLSGGDFTAVDASRMWEKEKYLFVLEALSEAKQMPGTVDNEDFELMMRLLDKAESGEDDEYEDKEYRKARTDPRNPTEDVDKRCKNNQTWQLGKHTLIVGNSLNEERVRKLKPADLIVADPPYGINLQKNKKSRNVGIADNIYKAIAGDESFEVVENFLKLYPRIFDKAKYCVWGANHFCHLLPGESGWIIWDKLGEDIPSISFSDCEIAWTNSKKPARIYRQIWYGQIREGKEEFVPRFHVNQKPVALYEWIYTQLLEDAKGIVIDPFCGSGSSILAAENFEDVTVTAFEIDPDFANVIIHRWEAKTGETATKAG